MLKLKFQYFGHLMQKVDSLEKTLILGGIGGRRRRGWQRMRWLDGITDLMGMSLSKGRKGVPPGVVMDREAWRAAIHGVTKSWTRLSDWTELNWTELNSLLWGFPGGSVVKNPTIMQERQGSIPGLGWSPEEGNGNPLQDSCLGNPIDREARRATVHGSPKSRTTLTKWLNNNKTFSTCTPFLPLLMTKKV